MLLSAIERVAVESDGALYIDRRSLREDLDRTSFNGIIGPIRCVEFGDCGTGRLTVIHHTDSRSLEESKNNIVFDFSP